MSLYFAPTSGWLCHYSETSKCNSGIVIIRLDSFSLDLYFVCLIRPLCTVPFLIKNYENREISFGFAKL